MIPTGPHVAVPHRSPEAHSFTFNRCSAIVKFISMKETNGQVHISHHLKAYISAQNLPENICRRL